MPELEIGDSEQVTGTDIAQLRRALAALPLQVERDVVDGALLAAAQVIRDEARANAPVLTGFYQSTIVARRQPPGRGRRNRGPRGGGDSIHQFRGRTGANVYAGRLAFLLEYGHQGPRPAPAHPHLIPALVSTSAQQLRAYARVATRGFEKVARQLASGQISGKLRRLAGR